MILYPNCKLNLGLHVLRKRADGYHDLETLFIPCDAYRDRLEIVPLAPGKGGTQPAPGGDGTQLTPGTQPAPGGDQVRFIGSAEVTWTDDLTVRAWRLLHEEFGIPPVEIRLEKRTPVGAGLGGGSADAAFALRALRDLFALPLDDDALAARAARLGSDCAFFIYNRPMFGTGRGEVLEPFELDLSAYRVEVVIPAGVSVSTADAYRGIVPRDRRPAPPSVASTVPSAPSFIPSDPSFIPSDPSVIPSDPSVIPSDPSVIPSDPSVIPSAAKESIPDLRAILRRPVAEWKDLLVNDFEETVFAAHPVLATLKQDLYDRGAVYAAMSGSGSALFGLFEK